MILSVTTLQDSVSNVEKWVRRNLAGGIDHMVVFLDGPQPAVEELLDGHPDVSPVRADRAWYADAPSLLLNDRQTVNAGLTSRLVAGMPWAQWLFHLDGDEVAQIDRRILDALAPGTRVVRLGTLEAVGQLRPESDPTLFKRRPSPDELHLLHLLGVISEPSVNVYFRGHRHGKPGLRTLTPDLAISVHNVIDRDGRVVAPLDAAGLRLLHYESFSGEEFARKWVALLGSGGHVVQRRHRASVAAAVRAVLSRRLDEDDTRALLDRIYEKTSVDDVELLRRLGLLVEVDPDASARTVTSSAVGVRQLRTLLERAREVAKAGFVPKSLRPDLDDVVAGLQHAL